MKETKRFPDEPQKPKKKHKKEPPDNTYWYAVLEVSYTLGKRCGDYDTDTCFHVHHEESCKWKTNWIKKTPCSCGYKKEKTIYRASHKIDCTYGEKGCKDNCTCVCPNNCDEYGVIRKTFKKQILLEFSRKRVADTMKPKEWLQETTVNYWFHKNRDEDYKTFRHRDKEEEFSDDYSDDYDEDDEDDDSVSCSFLAQGPKKSDLLAKYPGLKKIRILDGWLFPFAIGQGPKLTNPQPIMRGQEESFEYFAGETLEEVDVFLDFGTEYFFCC